MRGVAAILVLLYHLGALSNGAGPLGRPVPSAYLAVDLFFLLSGFVVALAYEEQLRSGLSLARFAWVRIVRLYPLALLGTLVSAAAIGANALLNASPAGAAWVARDLAKALVFLPHLRGDNDLFPLNPPMWSLLWEVAINLCYAAALPWLTDRKLAIVAGLGALGVVASAITWGSLNVGVTTGTALGGLARVAWSFPLGVLMYRRWRRGALRRMPRAPAILLPVGLILACAPAYRSSHAWAPVSLIVLLLFPALLLMALQAEPSGRTRSAFAWLGLLSYPVYALHWGLFQWAMTISRHTDSGIGTSAAAFLALPVALIATRFWDVPLRRRLSRLGKVRPATVAAAPPL